MEIIKKEIIIEEDLKQKLEIICSFCNTKPTIINGSIRSINKTNLNYIEPHKIIIKGITFLAFNYSKDIYIGNINNKIKITELENYLKNTQIFRLKFVFLRTFFFFRFNAVFIETRGNKLDKRCILSR